MINEKGFTNEKLKLWYKIEESIVFAYHNPSTRLIASLTESVKRAQTVFGHLKWAIISDCTDIVFEVEEEEEENSFI